MNRTASVLRVAHAHARAKGLPAARLFARTARQAGYVMPNTLSIEVPIEATPRDWDMFEDVYIRDWDDVVMDLANLFRNETFGKGQVRDMIQDRDGVRLYVEFPKGAEVEDSLYALERAITRYLDRAAKYDAGIAVLLFGREGRGRLDLEAEVEAWDD
jgi:hypothetical protein